MISVVQNRARIAVETGIGNGDQEGVAKQHLCGAMDKKQPCWRSRNVQGAWKGGVSKSRIGDVSRARDVSREGENMCVKKGYFSNVPYPHAALLTFSQTSVRTRYVHKRSLYAIL